MPGDANRDGAVDDADASILAAHWQTASGATWEMGDFNVDGAVNDKRRGAVGRPLDGRRRRAFRARTVYACRLAGIVPGRTIGLGATGWHVPAAAKGAVCQPTTPFVPQSVLLTGLNDQHSIRMGDPPCIARHR